MKLFDHNGNMRGWPENAESEEPGERFVELIACGDTGPVRNLETVVLEKGPDHVLNDMLKELNSADIIFANLEAPYSERGQAMDKIPTFRLDPKAFSLITCGGINAVSLANNHIFDYGLEAFDDTVKLLRAGHIAYFGAGRTEEEAIRPAVMQANGVKLAFLGFMDKDQIAFLQKQGSGAVCPMALKNIRDAVETIRGHVDWVILSLHFGLEYTMYPAPRDVAFCRKLIDSGVDIIVGHHPHYPQGVEKYRHGLIAYSLGNFIWDQKFVGHTASSYMLKIRMSKDRITSVRTIPFKMNYSYRLEKGSQSDALEEIELLSAVLQDPQNYSQKWYFVSRNFFLNALKNLYSIPFGNDKRRQILNWMRNVTSFRSLYTIGCFLLYIVSFRSLIYEVKKKL